MSLVCRRCRHRFKTSEQFSVGYHKYAQPMRWWNLCGECTDGLRSWIGIPPEIPPVSADEVAAKLPGRPPSHYFEP